MAPSCAAGNDVNNYNGSFVDVRARPLRSAFARAMRHARERCAHQHTHTYSSFGSYLRPLVGLQQRMAFAPRLPPRWPLQRTRRASSSRHESVLAASWRAEKRPGTEPKLPETSGDFRTAARVPKSAPSEPGAAGVAAVAGVGRWNARCATWRARTCSRSEATRLSGRCGLFGGEAHAHVCAAHGPYTYMHTHAHAHTHTHTHSHSHTHSHTHTHTCTHTDKESESERERGSETRKPGCVKSGFAAARKPLGGCISYASRRTSHACDACAAVHSRVRRAADERHRVGALSG
jgi:hypothetical protein